MAAIPVASGAWTEDGGVRQRGILTCTLSAGGTFGPEWRPRGDSTVAAWRPPGDLFAEGSGKRRDGGL